jgi:hypothetical protein
MGFAPHCKATITYVMLAGSVLPVFAGWREEQPEQ